MEQKDGTGQIFKSGEEQERFIDCLGQAYSEEELERLLRFRLDDNLYNYVGKGLPLTELIFDLVQKAIRKGWIAEFVREAYEERKGNRCLEEFATRVVEAEPEPPPPLFADDEWCDVVAGSVVLGCDDGPELARPRHEVTLTYAYAISKKPITNAHYQLFYEVERNEAFLPRNWFGGEPRGGTLDEPVNAISWEAAQSFCAWLNANSQEMRFALPTEAEWHGALAALDVYDDMLEWTRTCWGHDWHKPHFGYPYQLDDGRDDDVADRSKLFVLLEGKVADPQADDQQSRPTVTRHWYYPDYNIANATFRVVRQPAEE